MKDYTIEGNEVLIEGKRPRCNKGCGAELHTAHIFKDGKWVKIGMYCNNCGVYEPFDCFGI